jgi:integrase/recombinase XerD
MVSHMSELIPVAPSLTPEQFRQLSDVLPELEWLANITNAKTRRAYKVDVAEFMRFSGFIETKSLRAVARSHVIAWRKDMESRSLAPTSIRRKLSALSSLFDYLCERNAVLGNPVDGVKRPASNNNEGSTPALGDAQVRRLLEAPAPDTLKGVRDRAILATLLYHGIRREELCLFACVTCRAASASCISASRGSATRFGLFLFTRWCCGLSVSTSKRGSTAAA